MIFQINKIIKTMKKRLLITLMLAVALVWGGKNVWGQSQPGDIAFIAANVDGSDDFAFVTMVDIPAGTNIYFTDNEWNGTAFTDLNEGELTWTNGEVTLSAGSVVVFTDPLNSSTGSVNIGSFTGSGWNLGSSDEWFYALLSEPATTYVATPVFLAAMASDAGTGWLTGTGLTEGTNAFDFNDDADGYKYTGVRDGKASFSAYLPLIMNSSNWQIELSNGENILPISPTSFTITGGGNTPPSITNIVQTPSVNITSSTSVSVSADITDSDGTVDLSQLKWGTSTGVYPNTINMTKGSGDTYTTDSDIPAQVNGTTVYFVIYAEDDVPDATTSPQQSYTVLDPATTTLPYTETFDANLGDCYTYSVSGATKVWGWVDGGYAAMNGYNSGDTEEDWLILPGINLDNYSDEILSFDSWYQYGDDDADNYLKLMYSTDYTGIGDPSGSTWNELSFTPPGAENTWSTSGDIDLSAISGTSVWIAFKYHYLSGSYRSWGIDNISIAETLWSVTFNVDMTNAGTYSEVQVAGSFEGWTGTTMSLVSDNIYTFTTAATFSADDAISFKFRKVDGGIVWENNPNRAYTVVAGTNTYNAIWNVMFPVEITWANLQWPDNGNIPLGGSYDVYGRVYANGLTGTQGVAPNLNAWVGYSTADTDPSTWTNWVTAAYNEDYGDNEEYKADLMSSITTSGTYYYATRFKLGLGDYVYGGYNSGGGDVWDGTTYVSGTLVVTAAEPTHHVTEFDAEANSSSTINLTWLDAAVGSGETGAEYYLIKGSTVSYDDITAPADGTPETDGTLVHNVASGVQTYQFTGLTASTAYYFKIYPYNGTGAAINYKTDETVPETSATTQDYSPPVLFISEVADPEDNANAKFVELFNAGSSTIVFSSENWYLSRQANGSSSSWADAQITTGSIAPGESYIISYSSSTFNSSYGFDSDMNQGTVVSGNGNDGYFLYYGGDHTTGTLVDAYGVINEDGSGKAWEYTDAKAVRLRSVSSPNPTWTASEWHIPAQANVSDMTPSAHAADVTWQGTTDSDWNIKGNNWSGTYGFIPDASFNVTIPSIGITNYPTISAEASCNNLSIESTASGDASILGDNNLTVNGTVSVERYITGGVWHDLSASTQNQTVNNLFFDHNPDVWLKSYNEPDNSRTNITSLSAPLSSGAGFEIWVETGDNVTVSFDGPLKTANVTLTTSSTPPLSYSGAEPLGYNLIGNPFASPLDWDEGTWALSNMTNGIWVWNGSTYLDWVGGVGSLTDGIIPMGQGFFVQTTSAAASITIPMDARVHSTQTYYKGAASTPDHMWIKAIKGEKNDQLTIVFADDATEGYDNGRDARKMMAFSGNAPQIYTLEQDKKFSVDGLPTLTEAGRTVSVMYHVGESGEQRLLANLESLPEATVVLEDKLTGAVQDLNENPEYIFEAEKGDDPERFALYFNPTPTTLNELNNNADLHVYAFKNEIYIRSAGDAANTSKSVWVYDMHGRIILNTIIPPSTLTQLPLDVKNTPVIVKVAGSGSVVTTKVVIN